MKAQYIFIILLGAACFQCDGQSKTPGSGGASNASLKTKADSLGYALGNNLGEFLKANGVTELSKDLNSDLLVKGIKDAIGNQKPPLTKEQCSQAINNFVMVKRTESVTRNKEAGKKFLAENGKKAGVVTTPSGWQYQIVKEGNGPKAQPQDQVQVHYHGTLLDGTVFDSSVDRGEPIVHSASGFITAWNEAISMMPAGSKWKLWIPSDLAYGDSGAGPTIPPGATLVFDLELIKVNP